MIEPQRNHPGNRTVVPPLCAVGYHEFSAIASRDVYQVTPEIFEQHLRVLRAGSTGRRRELRVTFDDGHRSQIEIAAPLLERLGLRGCFFVPAGWVGCRSETADWHDLRRLVTGGHSIGSHGNTHALLTHCTPETLRWELVRSRERLEDGLGCAVQTISLPGGRGSAAVTAACQAAGYTEVYTSDPRMHGVVTGDRQHDPITLHGRLVVRRTTRPALLERYAAHDPLTMAQLGFGYRSKTTLKRVLGDVAYQTMWRRLLRAPAAAEASSMER